MVMTRGPAQRCACGRARRRAATACQKCLDAAAVAAQAGEPPRKLAHEWRREGWLVAIYRGLVLLAPIRDKGLEIRTVRATFIDGGRWSRYLDPKVAPWRPLTDFECASTIGPHLRAVLRDCYCRSALRPGCDFCNGLRKPEPSEARAAR